jgi:hypothetical protein
MIQCLSCLVTEVWVNLEIHVDLCLLFCNLFLVHFLFAIWSFECRWLPEYDVIKWNAILRDYSFASIQ